MSSSFSIIRQLEENLSFQENDPLVDASVLLALTAEEEPKILLTRRAQHMRHHAGEVSLPGGKRDKTDPSNIAVALREAEEETALNPKDVKLLGDLPLQRSKAGVWVKPIVGLIPPQLTLVAQPTEIERIFYMPLKCFIDTPIMPHMVVFQQEMIHFPSIQFDDEVIWGLTARIVVALFDTGLKQKIEWPFILNRSK